MLTAKTRQKHTLYQRVNFGQMLFDLQSNMVFTKYYAIIQKQMATSFVSSNHWANQKCGYCKMKPMTGYVGIFFSTVKDAIILYLSFLNCGWLLVREVEWFYWTQELLVPVEKFTVRMPMVRLELATLGYKPSALAIELYSSKAMLGRRNDKHILMQYANWINSTPSQQ